MENNKTNNKLMMKKSNFNLIKIVKYKLQHQEKKSVRTSHLKNKTIKSKQSRKLVKHYPNPLPKPKLKLKNSEIKNYDHSQRFK